MRYGSPAHAWWWGGLFILILIAALVSVGCGSSDQASVEEEGQQEGASAGAGEETAPPATPIKAVQVAYKKTADAKTAKVDMTMSMGRLPNGMSMDFSGQGAIDFENRNADMTISVPQMMGGKGKGKGPQEMGEIETRQIGTTIYQRMPEPMRAQMSGGKPWIRMDLDTMMQEQYGAGLREMQGNAASSDPTQQLAYLEGASGSVEEVGEEEVRGEQTTHYRADLDLEKAVEAQGLEGEARGAYDQLTQQLGTTTLPVDVWIDGEGRVRRYEMSLPISPPPQGATAGGTASPEGQQTQMKISEELYGFGTPVEVEAPPEDQVADMAELMNAAQQRQD